MSFDPYAPYGALVDTTLRVVTWNVWGRYGAIEQREADIEDELAAVSPDVVGLVESWSTADANQADLVGNRLGLEHRMFVAGMDVDDWSSGLGLASRWPVVTHEHRNLYGKDGAESGAVLFAALDGPRGSIEVFLAATDYPLDASAVRQDQVRQLAAFVRERTRQRSVTIVFGDFNAGPEADEMRTLTGQSDTAAPGLVFYDAWEIAGDDSPGYTWSNSNPLAAVGLYPNRRIDYILSAWPRAHGVGHPTHCERLGVVPPDQPQLSDHYGVLADLRY